MDRLEAAGCVSFREDNPKRTIKFLLHRLQPAILKKKITKRLEFDINLGDNVKLFIKTVIRDSKNCQQYYVEPKATAAS